MPPRADRDLFAISDIAETTARLFGVDHERTKIMNRQVRNLVTQQLVGVTERRGGRGDAYMNDREAAKAVLQLALIDTGFDATMLREVVKLFDLAVDSRLRGLPIAIDGYSPPRALDVVLRDVACTTSPAWELVVYVRRDTETGERFVVGGFARADQEPWPVDDPRSMRGDAADGVASHEGTYGDDGKVRWTRRGPLLTIAEIRIPATELLFPIVRG